MRFRIKTGLHVLVIQPERNMTVSVKVEIHDVEPLCDADRWDHIAEASLHLPTGQLEVHECTGGPVADSASIRAGIACVRATAGSIRSTSPDSKATTTTLQSCGRPRMRSRGSSSNADAQVAGLTPCGRTVGLIGPAMG